MDYRVEKHADIIVNYSIGVKKEDEVLIIGNIETLELLRATYKQVLESGGFPKINITDQDFEEILLKTGNEKQLKYLPESTKYDFKNMDCIISIWGDKNTRNLSGTDPKKQKLKSQGRRELRDIMMERIGNGDLRWCGTQYPTQSNAQEANMSLRDYEDFVYGACHINKDDPVSVWKKIDEKQEKLCKILNKKKHLKIISEGTELEMDIKGRKWINCSGKENFPDGEVFTCPIKETVNGKISFSYPAIFSGREVEGVELIFKDGKVIKATAEKGEEFLKEILDTDEGSRYTGEIAVGTNYNIQDFTKNILFDEKIGGTVHLALGAAMPEAGGKNKSSLHWDMICDMKESGKIYADGELIYEKGKFLIEY